MSDALFFGGLAVLWLGLGWLWWMEPVVGACGRTRLDMLLGRESKADRMRRAQIGGGR